MSNGNVECIVHTYWKKKQIIENTRWERVQAVFENRQKERKMEEEKKSHPVLNAQRCTRRLFVFFCSRCRPLFPFAVVTRSILLWAFLHFRWKIFSGTVKFKVAPCTRFVHVIGTIIHDWKILFVYITLDKMYREGLTTLNSLSRSHWYVCQHANECAREPWLC